MTKPSVVSVSLSPDTVFMRPGDTEQLTADVVAEAGASDAVDLESLQTVLSFTKSKTLANGTGNDQNNVIWSDQRTLAASDTDTSQDVYERFGAFPWTGTIARLAIEPGPLAPDSPVSMIDLLREMGARFE